MTLTPEEKAVLFEFRDKWIARQCERSSEADIRIAVAEMWRHMDQAPPHIVVVDSPREAVNVSAHAYKHKDGDSAAAAEGYLKGGIPRPAITDRREVPRLESYWWAVNAVWAQAMVHLGKMESTKKLTTFIQWCEHVTFCCPYDTFVAVSHKPELLKWNEDGLHCEDGPAVQYRDGFKIYALEGHIIDEKIIEAPDTQTIAEIHAEENEEVRRMRIERFGWRRYLIETESQVVDERRNDLECTYEVLADTPQGLRLLTHCPSTGRRYALAIADRRVKSCEAAQHWLVNNVDCIPIGRT